MNTASGGSASKPGALFLSPEAPYPVAGGGPLRSASVLEFLSSRYSVDVITFREPGARDPRAAFPPGTAASVWVIDLPFHAKSIVPQAIRNAIRAAHRAPPLLDRFSGFAERIKAFIAEKYYELGVIEHFWCAPYAAQLRPHCRRLALNLHNVESALHASIAETERGVTSAVHRRFAADYRNLEERWLPQFDLLLTPSEDDAARIAPLCGGASAVVYPNALPAMEQPLKRERDVIVFSGNLEYPPNLSAIRYFRKAIWPGLRARFPSLCWELAGKNSGPAAKLVRGDNRIRLTGAMDGAAPPFLASAKAAVVPLLSGSGTRLKILEAWAAATPVVSTSLGAEGLCGAHGRDLLIADSPAEFAGAVQALLASQAERERIGLAGRRLYERHYTWESAWRILGRELLALG